MISELERQNLYPFCQKKLYPRGSTIFEEGGIGDGLLLLLKGRVKLLKKQPQDRTFLLYIFMPPEIFGFLPFFDEEPYPGTAVALDDVEIMIMDRVSLIRAISKNPEIAITLLKTLATKLRKSFESTKAASFRGVGPTVAMAILSLISPFYQTPPIHFSIPHPSYEFARDIGVTPETLSRELSKLVKERVVHRVKGGKYQVLRFDLLKESALCIEIH